jgi:hypothetical protein
MYYSEFLVRHPGQPQTGRPKNISISCMARIGRRGHLVRWFYRQTVAVTWLTCLYIRTGTGIHRCPSSLTVPTYLRWETYRGTYGMHAPTLGCASHVWFLLFQQKKRTFVASPNASMWTFHFVVHHVPTARKASFGLVYWVLFGGDLMKTRVSSIHFGFKEARLPVLSPPSAIYSVQKNAILCRHPQLTLMAVTRQPAVFSERFFGFGPPKQVCQIVKLSLLVVFSG